MKHDEISFKKKRNLGPEVVVGSRLRSLCRKDYRPKSHKYDDLNADT